ncbi:uncharacterized protein LOC131944500 [Physella acuta]|uniref:uncharacterized protein LOC131944500 n=1 Tax=Physella acuta TaxID=109671 RepID=UPI0027DD04D8|nr:uncharacterized protein LOC131944500 [Physella acuta]
MKVLLLLVASAFVAEGTITLNLPGRLEIPTLKINGGEPSIKFGSSGFSISTNGVAGKSGNSNTNQASVSFKFGTKLGNQGQGVGFGAGGALVPKRKKLRVKGGKKGKKVGVSKNAGAGVGDIRYIIFSLT